MKKIIFGIISAFTLTFALASCSNTDNVTLRVDNPKTELYNSLGLEATKNGTDVYTVDTTKSDYIEMKIAEDYKNSMFIYKLDLDEYMTEEKIKENGGSAISGVKFNVLTFSGEITDTEKASFISAFYNTSTGIKTKIYGTFDVITLTSWSYEASITDAKAKYDQGQRNNCLAVLYMPTYIYRVKAGNPVLQAFAMMPVYYEITTYTDSKFASEVLNNYSIKTLTFNSNNLLESN